jgi:tRNA threonylcarbamoyladenosine biosynthesis protein TsaB
MTTPPPTSDDPSGLPPAAPPAPPLGPFLALDTSGPTARVALLDADGRVLAADQRTSPRHSTILLPLCHDLFQRTGVAVHSLRGIACGSGPGSFTGLRVGLAVAKGLALGFDLPLVLVSSLAALAIDLAAATTEDLLAPAIDAGKGEIYVQLYRRSSTGVSALGPEVRALPGPYALELKTSGQRPLLGGTGADRHHAALAAVLGDAAVVAGFPGPSAKAVGQLGLPRLLRGERDDLGTAVPVYGRPPDITTPKPRA